MVSRKNRKGTALLMSMIVLAVLSAWAVAVCSFSGSSIQLAKNQHKANFALAAAESGIECGKYLITTVPNLPTTGNNIVSSSDADITWSTLCSYVQAQMPSGKTVPAATNFTDTHGSGKQLIVPAINFSASSNPSTDPNFVLRFYRYTNVIADQNTIKLESTGRDDSVSRKITIDMNMQKSADVLRYAIASRTRVWITGDSTIYGPIYSSWKYQHLSPFNMTSDSEVVGITLPDGTYLPGTINTILTNTNPTTHLKGPDLYADTTKMPYDLETLDSYGNPEYDASGNKIIGYNDEIQGQSDGINYGVEAANLAGMKLSDYDTSSYKAQTTAPADSTIYNYNHDIHGNPTTPAKVTEYFPHTANNYSQPSSSGSLKLYRYVCQDKTLTNFQVKPGRNALFKDCTFDGILYVDNSTSANDVRFENCTFNGPIVTTPSTDTSSGWWQRNQLYFTGTETFQTPPQYNTTVLAPNFNVNLGNTDPTASDHNILTGAIVGGIVDVRGNAQVNGTIISMFDTSGYSSGYVSNIGATLDDGGSETVSLGDVGTITIRPDPSRLLPSGVMTPITIKPLQNTYAEGF